MVQSYRNFVEATVKEGARIQSRYGLTFERTNQVFTVPAGVYPRRPGLAPAIGILEGLFLVGGFFSLDAIKQVAPGADHSLFHPLGAYGPRVEDQLMRLIENLEKDLESRQHVLFVGRNRDQYSTWMPCTTSLHFLVRKGTMDLYASMRSSDILKGLPTDLIQFGILLQVIARCFEGIACGHVHVQATSSHVYTADYITKRPLEDRLGAAFVTQECTGSPMHRFVQYASWAKLAVDRHPWENGLPRGISR